MIEGATAEPLLVASALRVGYRRPLLEGVDWTLRPGESWFVLGRNGSGKTCLVATVLGLVRPLGGVVKLQTGLRSALGYVPQEPRFDPPLPCTVSEFVEIGLPVRETRAAARVHVGEALAALDIGRLERARMDRLSVGQRRRALIARALARRPRLLVLDEPTANLDTEAATQLAADLGRLCAEHGLCVVHVSHDAALARRHATHLLLVRDGRVTTGPAASLVAVGAEGVL